MTSKMKTLLSPLVVAAIMAIVLLSFGGCGSVEPTVTPTPLPRELAYLDELEPDTFYIRHSDYTLDVPFFGEATFDYGTIRKDANNLSIMWFKEDFDNIPTLFEGDSLIFMSTKDIEPHYTFERFKDYGYTVGIRNLSYTETGRVSIDTKAQKKCSYPGGDTDVFLDFEDENSIIVIDKVGDIPVRATSLISVDDNNNGLGISACGTLTGLQQDMSYSFDTYAGTIYYRYVFKADVRTLGQIESKTSVAYEYEGGVGKNGKLINIEIPYWFKSGYYMINGVGMFRYIRSEDYTTPAEGLNVINPEADLNVPNSDPGKAEDYYLGKDAPYTYEELVAITNGLPYDENGNVKTEHPDVGIYTYDEATQAYVVKTEQEYGWMGPTPIPTAALDEADKKFNVTEVTNLTIVVTFAEIENKLKLAPETDYTDFITAINSNLYLVTPNGERFKGSADSRSIVFYIENTIPGGYTLDFGYLFNLTPLVEVKTANPDSITN